MRTIKVKICGITNKKDAQAAVRLGADAVGFVFYKKSPRYILPEVVRSIIKDLPNNIKKIGVFVNAREKSIRRIAKLCKLDMIQFHGNESPRFCERFKDYKIIKAFRIKEKNDLKRVLKYKPFAFLFDTFIKSKAGGTGKNFNWRLVKHLEGTNRPIFLSGGLNEKNIQEAMQIVRPEWVDVSSSVEISPGKKDHQKVKKFVKIAKSIVL